MGSRKQKSWFDRNWKWFVPVLCFGTLVLLAAFAGVILAVVFGAMKSSDAYQQALAAAKRDPRVIQALGSPVQEGLFLTGNINVSGTSGDADLAIPISGPKGKGTIYVVATKSIGTWNFSNLVVAVEGSANRIDLKTPVRRK